MLQKPPKQTAANNGLHEIKTKNRKCNSHQDLPNNSGSMQYYQEKENTNQETVTYSEIFWAYCYLQNKWS